VVSSSAIRKAVSEGRVERARLLLGRPFTLAGLIRPGTGQGRHLVVPTLNLSYQQELVPRRGVYASESVVGGRLYRSATNVGIRPTFDGGGLTVESHLLGFSETLTSGPMELRFWKRLRNEKKFPSADSLRAQILRDIERAARFFSRLDARPTPSRRNEATAVQSAS
jgi:riboflavin kinase/FMN adenylyltransferase